MEKNTKNKNIDSPSWFKLGAQLPEDYGGNGSNTRSFLKLYFVVRKLYGQSTYNKVTSVHHFTLTTNQHFKKQLKMA